MHEEFQSNWEGANVQYKRRTLCHSKVILKGSRIVTCYLLGEEGEAAAAAAWAERENYSALFSWWGQKDTLRGPKALPIATPGGFIFSAASHAPATSPGWLWKSPWLSKRPPLATSVAGFPQLFLVPLSFPGNSSIRNFALPRTAGAVIGPVGRGAPAPPRCLSGVS